MSVSAHPRVHSPMPAVPRRGHFWLVAIVWTIFAVYGSLVPLKYQAVELGDALEKFRNLPPLWVGMGARADWVANILLFIPLTFLWVGAFTLGRGRLATVIAALFLSLVAAIAAVALEFTQIWFAGRTVSRNDILAETIGGCVGALAWLVLGQRIVAWLRSLSVQRTPRSALRWFLEAYLVGFAIYSVIPLDLTISLTELYGKYRSGALLLVPFSYGYDAPATVVYQFFSDIATFLPVGAWVALAWRDRLPGRSAFVVGVAGGGAIALAIEFVQLLVRSRFTDTTDIILGALGAGIGSWWMVRTDNRLSSAPTPIAAPPALRGAMIWLAGLVGYSLLLVVGFLYPFDWTTDRVLIRARYEGFFRVPFLALYQGSEFNAIKQFLIRFLMFAPLGIIVGRLAAFPRSPIAQVGVRATGFGYAALLALGIEVAQIFMPARIADSTEVAICIAGTIAGLLIVRRLLAPGGR